MTEIRKNELEGVLEIVPKRFGDDRGFFSETYNRKVLKDAGVDLDFVQDNQSYSARRGVLRGLHYQLPPFAQDKLVRVVKGAIFDVAIDIRRSSPQFGKWHAIEISATKWNQLLVPKGFAHGFVTLEEDTEVIYKTTDFYSPEHDRAIRYDDPTIGIDWPLGADELQLSPKDRGASWLDDANLFD